MKLSGRSPDSFIHIVFVKPVAPYKAWDFSDVELLSVLDRLRDLYLQAAVTVQGKDLDWTNPALLGVNLTPNTTPPRASWVYVPWANIASIEIDPKR